MQKVFFAFALLLLAIPALRAYDGRFLQNTEVQDTETQVTETTTTQVTETTETEVAVPVENVENVENVESTLLNPTAVQTTAPVSVFPTSLLNTFAVDVHYYSGLGLNTSHVAYHFCTQLVPEFIQCDLYDGVANTSRLIGIELITTADVLGNFSVEERKLWYSNAFQVKNGLLVFPELSPADELLVLNSLVNTFSKTVELYAQNSFQPTGVPQLVMGWVTDSQVNPAIVNQIDTTLNLTNTAAERAAFRSNLTTPQFPEGVNDFLVSGLALQYQEFNITVNNTNGEPILQGS